MRGLAARYAAAKQNGMAGVTSEIEACYTAGTRSPVNPWTLRDCLILDAVGTREDNNVGRAIYGINLPYFERQRHVSRWARYGQLAGFNDATRQVRYMSDGAALVELQLRQVEPAI